MRKITKQAVTSFTNGETFNSGNTKVTFENGIGKMFLHDNLIAIMDESENIEVSLAGWNTKTTRERLNGIPGVSIHTVNGSPILNGKIIEADKFYTV
jgi:hypothetical protein